MKRELNAWSIDSRSSYRRLMVSEPRSEARSFRGRWWIAGTERSATGTLWIRGRRDATLELFGALVDDWPVSASIILGELYDVEPELESMTLNRITVGQATGKVRRSRGSISTAEEWRCDDILIGTWQVNPEAAGFTQYLIETDRLRDWASTRRPSEGAATESTDIHSVALPPPDPVTWEIEGLGKAELAWLPRSSHGRLDATVSLRPILYFLLDEPKSREWAWRHLVTPTLQLMMLVTGSGDRIHRLGVSGSEEHTPEGMEEPHPYGAIEWLPSVWANQDTEGTIWHDHLASLDDAALLPNFISDWLSHAYESRLALLQFFAPTVGDSVDLEDRFTRIVRGLEIWHRLNVPGQLMPDAEFEAAMAAMRGALERDVWSRLRDRLIHANDLSLRERIEATVSLCLPEVQAVVEMFPKFASRVTRSRNGLVHEGQKGTDLTYSQMYLAQKLMEVIMHLRLLASVGLSEGEVWTAMQRSRRWEWIIRVIRDRETGLSVDRNAIDS